jgi:hypothetical protein
MSRILVIKGSRSSRGSRLNAVRMRRVVIVEVLTKTTAQCVSQYAGMCRNNTNNETTSLHMFNEIVFYCLEKHTDRSQPPAGRARNYQTDNNRDEVV